MQACEAVVSSTVVELKVPAGWCASGFYLHDFISKTCRVLKLKENERCFLGLSWPLQLAGGLGADPSEYCISCWVRAAPFRVGILLSSVRS